MTDYIEVDFYVCGVYRGKRKIGRKSICGMLLSGDLEGGLNKVSEMVDDLNQIPGVKATNEPVEVINDTRRLRNPR